MMNTEETNTLTLSLLEEAIAYHRWIFEKICPYLGENILEVGCGIGNLTGLLLGQGKVIATDVNEDYLRTVKKKYQDDSNLNGVFLWDIREEPSWSVGGAIDTIVCSNVLEHIEDDDSVLKNFHRLLPAGGSVILLVPALKGLYNSFDRELGHFRRYSRDELVQKLTRSGFRILDLRFFNLFGILGWFVNGTLLRRRLLPERQVRIFNRLVPFFVWMEKRIPNLVGQSLIAAGERV
jgi:SAM-dependent methyltransferase